MSGAHHVDQAKTESGSTREELAEMVRLTTDEQRLCRIEGLKIAHRLALPFYSEFADELEHEGRRRWGDLWDKVK